MAAATDGITVQKLRDATYFAITEFNSSLKLYLVWWQKLNLTFWSTLLCSAHMLQRLNKVNNAQVYRTV